MGCCPSRFAGHNGRNPYPPTQPNSASAQAAPDASSRNITAPSPSPRRSQASQSPSAAQRPSANDRPNAPLKPLTPNYRSSLPTSNTSPSTSRSRSRSTPLTNPDTSQWTRSILNKERNDWWDTRVTGSPDVWQIVHTVVNRLQGGDLQEAQTILDASECTCPNGEVWKGVYDPTGAFYKVPEWVIFEPEGLREESEEPEGTTARPGDGTEERAQETESWMLKFRLSTTGQDVNIRVHRGEKIASIIDKLRKQQEIPEETNIRITYSGKMYKEDEDLEAHHLWDYNKGHVLSTLLIERSPTPYCSSNPASP